MRWLWFKIYDATLYKTERSISRALPAGPSHYLREGHRALQDLLEATAAEWQPARPWQRE